MKYDTGMLLSSINYGIQSVLGAHCPAAAEKGVNNKSRDHGVSTRRSQTWRVNLISRSSSTFDK